MLFEDTILKRAGETSSYKLNFDTPQMSSYQELKETTQKRRQEPKDT